MSGLFGGLFDFNRDGKTDIFETALGLSIIDQAAREEEEARRRAAEADDFLLDIDIDEDLPEDGQSLQDRLDELRDRLADLELEEPEDMFSEEYFAWEEAHEHLEERISELEDQIEGFSEGRLKLLYVVRIMVLLM